MHNPDEIEAALAKARQGQELSEQERATLREVLEWWRMWKAWGKLGRVALWLIITFGAVAAAAREIRGSGWFGS
jgi:hypothetical protein